MSNHYLTPEQVATHLAVSAEAVRRLIRTGALPATDISRPGARRPLYRIDPNDLADFVEGRRVAPPPPKRRRAPPTANGDYVKYFSES